MGQYYKAVNPEKKEHVSSYSYGNGAKLMEHSYIGNSYLGSVESLLVKGGRWYKQPVVWCGDYANDVDEVKDANGEVVNDLYDKRGLEIKPESVNTVPENYIVNHTKGLFVDKTKVPADSDHYQIHPLSILTSVGNGCGGGDLRSFTGNGKLIGSWCGDRISIEPEAPTGFKEIKFNLKENY